MTIAPPSTTRPTPAPSVVTHVIVVTTGDTRVLAVHGSSAHVPQQMIWEQLARQLAAQPAPNAGQTRIVHARDYSDLHSQFRAIAASSGGRVGRIDWVGHGSDAGVHTEGFHLLGIHSGPEQWVSPEDMVRLIADTGIAQRAPGFDTHFLACYSDVWVDRVANGLRQRGVSNPHAVGQIGDFTPAFGPRAGHVGDPTSRWVVDPTGPTRSSGEAAPTISARDLRGL